MVRWRPCWISVCALVLFLLFTLGVLPSAVAAPPPDTPAQGSPPTTHPDGPNPTPPQGPQDTPAATKSRKQIDPPVGTFSVDSFQTDSYTGAATASIPIIVPKGAAGTGPQIALTSITLRAPPPFQ